MHTENNPKAKNYRVAISSNRMGEGDEALGETLMKAFLYTLSQQEQLPDHILFYNSGAFLTCAGSQVLENLKAMEEKGVQVMTCGTCLDFYGLKEKLEAGTVTNMYTITDLLRTAGSVVRP